MGLAHPVHCTWLMPITLATEELSLKRLEAQLLALGESLAGEGRLDARVTHDLRNLVAIVRTYRQLCAETSTDVDGLLLETTLASERARRFIDEQSPYLRWYLAPILA